MTAITITIRGLDELVTKLTRASVIDAIEPAMTRAVLRLEARMKVYPPTLPNQRYIRTGTLGRRWTHRLTRTGDSLEGVVGNVTVYAPQVQSKRFQRPIFRGRWTTDEGAIEAERDNIVRDFEEAVREALR